MTPQLLAAGKALRATLLELATVQRKAAVRPAEELVAKARELTAQARQQTMAMRDVVPPGMDFEDDVLGAIADTIPGGLQPTTLARITSPEASRGAAGLLSFDKSGATKAFKTQMRRGQVFDDDMTPGYPGPSTVKTLGEREADLLTTSTKINDGDGPQGIAGLALEAETLRMVLPNMPPEQRKATVARLAEIDQKIQSTMSGARGAVGGGTRAERLPYEGPPDTLRQEIDDPRGGGSLTSERPMTEVRGESSRRDVGGEMGLEQVDLEGAKSRQDRLGKNFGNRTALFTQGNVPVVPRIAGKRTSQVVDEKGGISTVETPIIEKREMSADDFLKLFVGKDAPGGNKSYLDAPFQGPSLPPADRSIRSREVAELVPESTGRPVPAAVQARREKMGLPPLEGRTSRGQRRVVSTAPDYDVPVDPATMALRTESDPDTGLPLVRAVYPTKTKDVSGADDLLVSALGGGPQRPLPAVKDWNALSGRDYIQQVEDLGGPAGQNDIVSETLANLGRDVAGPRRSVDDLLRAAQGESVTARDLATQYEMDPRMHRLFNEDPAAAMLRMFAPQ